MNNELDPAHHEQRAAELLGGRRGNLGTLNPPAEREVARAHAHAALALSLRLSAVTTAVDSSMGRSAIEVVVS